jgi:hypothetical protein
MWRNARPMEGRRWSAMLESLYQHYEIVVLRERYKDLMLSQRFKLPC